MPLINSKPSEKPFHVRTTDGGLHSGFDTEKAAEGHCKEVNRRAEQLGITTRYVVKER